MPSTFDKERRLGIRTAKDTCAITRRSLLRTLAAASVLPLAGRAQAAAEKWRIGVIGAGSLGGTVGRLWTRAGHDVMFAARDLDRVRGDLTRAGVTGKVGTPQQAAAFGQILLFAVPYDALAELGRQLGADVRGKVVLDACNPSSGAGDALSREAEALGVGLMSARLLPGSRLVRAFSAVDATAVTASAGRSSSRLGVPLAGDDQHAIDVAARLVADAGCEPVVVGGLSDARSFQRGGPGFRANTDAADLRRRLSLPRS